jgi:hypothetical protein
VDRAAQGIVESGLTSRTGTLTPWTLAGHGTTLTEELAATLARAQVQRWCGSGRGGGDDTRT